MWRAGLGPCQFLREPVCPGGWVQLGRPCVDLSPPCWASVRGLHWALGLFLAISGGRGVSGEMPQVPERASRLRGGSPGGPRAEIGRWGWSSSVLAESGGVTETGSGAGSCPSRLSTALLLPERPMGTASALGSRVGTTSVCPW